MQHPAPNWLLIVSPGMFDYSWLLLCCRTMLRELLALAPTASHSTPVPLPLFFFMQALALPAAVL
jgi:hypothetical protein